MKVNLLRSAIILSYFSLIFLTPTNYVQAATIPSFFTCLNPQGDLKITNTGNHGVPGNQQSYDGTDQVYAQPGTDTLSSSTVVQCLCPTNGQGIQTNWWNASNLSDPDIQTLTAQGWIYIPDGSAWGLDPVPYLAQNTNYSCTNNATNGTNSVTSGNVSDGSTNNQNANNGSSNPTQAVLGAFSDLGSTGNVIILYELFGIGILSTFAAIILRKIK